MIISNVAHNNWTGEASGIKVNQSRKSFSFNGYTFTIKNIETCFDDDPDLKGGWFELHGDDWSSSLETLHFKGDFDLERAVRKSIAWVANHV